MKILNKTKIIGYSIAAILISIASSSALAADNILQINDAGLGPASFTSMDGGLSTPINRNSPSMAINMPGTRHLATNRVTLYNVSFQKSPAFVAFYQKVQSGMATPATYTITYNFNGTNYTHTLYSARVYTMAPYNDFRTGVYHVPYIKIEYESAVHSKE